MMQMVKSRGDMRKRSPNLLKNIWSKKLNIFQRRFCRKFSLASASAAGSGGRLVTFKKNEDEIFNALDLLIPGCFFVKSFN